MYFDFNNLYFLDETQNCKVKPVTNPLELLRAITSNRSVKSEDVREFWVSTIFLVRDLLEGTGIRKHLFETCIYKVSDRFTPKTIPYPLYMEHWSTAHEALVGHHYVVQLIKNGELPKIPTETVL
jgi:hypothetical protein